MYYIHTALQSTFKLQGRVTFSLIHFRLINVKISTVLHDFRITYTYINICHQGIKIPVVVICVYTIDTILMLTINRLNKRQSSAV